MKINVSLNIYSGFTDYTVWTSGTKNSTGKFVWGNQVEVGAFPFTVIHDLNAGKKIPGNFVRGTEMKVGTLIWWDNEPNMMEGFDVILAVADPSYGVGLLTDSPSSLRPVICEHKC